jgi:hypothetical protein
MRNRCKQRYRDERRSLVPPFPFFSYRSWTDEIFTASQYPIVQDTEIPVRHLVVLANKPASGMSVFVALPLFTLFELPKQNSFWLNLSFFFRFFSVQPYKFRRRVSQQDKPTSLDRTKKNLASFINIEFKKISRISRSSFFNILIEKHLQISNRFGRYALFLKVMPTDGQMKNKSMNQWNKRE